VNYRRQDSSIFTVSYVLEAVLALPAQRGNGSVHTPLLNNYVSVGGEFTRSVGVDHYRCSGVFYAQQNGHSSRCAHACLVMAINTLSQPMALTGSGINSLLALPNPENGLTIGQVIDVIKSSGRDALVINCADLPPGAFVSALAAIVRSGHAALVVFTTQGDEEHVVLVFGHTRNSDQWHPLAIPAYSGHISAHFIPSSQWVSHFLIHDDNFGPYYTLSSRALDLSASVKAHWIVGILADAPNILP
jgi:hypothetical protein